MANADVSVFLTDKADSTDPDIDLIVKNYLEHEAFVNSSTYGTPDVSINNETIPAPSEKAVREINVDACGDDAEFLLGWWKYYNDCHSLNLSADSNILITNDTSLGGRAQRGGKFAVSAGRQIQNLSTTSTSAEGSGSKWGAIATAIHEMGHNFGCVHSDGYAYESDRYERYFVSPLIDGYTENNDESSNGCNEISDIHTSSYEKYNRTRFEECELKNMNL